MEDINSWNTLEELEQRKLQLSGEIHTEEKSIRSLWDSVFHQKSHKPLLETPTQKLVRYLSMTSGVVDGALLGWKLYRKFKK